MFLPIINIDRLILKMLLFYTRSHYESDLRKKSIFSAVDLYRK